MSFQPKFLTKEERVAEALRKRQEAADEARKKMDEDRKKQMDFMKEARHFGGMLAMFRNNILSEYPFFSSN